MSQVKVILQWPAFLFLVVSGSKCSLRLDNVLLPTGESAVPYLVPVLNLQAGA